MKVLMVMAHADDEIICGWPILQNKNIEKAILLCSTDLHNLKRKWCSHRKYTFEKVCNELNIKIYKMLDYNSEFYRLETRKETLSNLISDILTNINNIKNNFKFDYIMTHNLYGEYGHIDHQLLFNIIASTNYNMIISDMYIYSNWAPYKQPYNIFKNCESENINNNINFYNKIKQIYEQDKVWTWDKEPIKNCNIFYINKDKI